jgi:hypothetical protein
MLAHPEESNAIINNVARDIGIEIGFNIILLAKRYKANDNIKSDSCQLFSGMLNFVIFLYNH